MFLIFAELARGELARNHEAAISGSTCIQLYRVVSHGASFPIRHLQKRGNRQQATGNRDK
ncbi:hypothetical protein [Okeania sp. SIO2C9]|uniref:hypothetical protein n=1 Tax=Okeania sp. SIO2C9 TaxID=2607791 RepID=UPI0025FDA8B3|nr:hypothetical protein [Okeania sp. SIO2C9]